MDESDGMLFVAHWTHTPENCPGRSKEGATMLNEFWAKRDLAAQKGVKILSAYVAVTEHTYYITVQAKSYQSLLEFFEPLAPTQIGAIHPVTTMDEWTKHIDPKRTSCVALQDGHKSGSAARQAHARGSRQVGRLVICRITSSGRSHGSANESGVMLGPLGEMLNG